MHTLLWHETEVWNVVCWTCYRCRNITFVHPLVVHGNRSFQGLDHPLNLSITQHQFHLETHCLFLHLRICLHCQKITCIHSSFMQEKKEMTTKLRPSCADSVTATSWSPWPKAWVGNHYGPARRVYYPETHSQNPHAGR